MSVDAHLCPGPGCRRNVPYERLACPRHWYQVPKALRDEVWAAYRALDDTEAAFRRHDLAMKTAIAAMVP